jgi:hypothetical protein
MNKRFDMKGLKYFLCLGALLTALVFSSCPPPVSNDIAYNGSGQDKTEELPGLSGTSWEWVGVKLEFKSETRVTMGTASYSYTYDRASKTGNAATLGAFTVSEDSLHLEFPSFMGSAEAVFDNSAAAIVGTTWFWGQGVLTFGMSKITINGVGYPYTYNGTAKTGTIEKIGSFSLDEDALTIQRWRGSGFNAVFSRGTAPEWNGSLVGTSWGWENAFNGWMIFEFMTESDCVLTFTNSTFHDDTPEEYTYSYNAGANTWTVPTQGTFSIGGNNAYISFVQWRDYPHGAVYNRIK